MEELIVSILAVIGIIFLFVVIYYFIARWMEYYQSASRPQRQFPSPEYEKMVGIQCPDYWFKQDNTLNGMNQCVNKYGAPVIPSNNSMCMVKDEKTGKMEPYKCYDDGSNNTKSFSVLDKWPVDNRKDIKDRCMWRDCCGRGNNLPASWVGIEKVCGF